MHKSIEGDEEELDDRDDELMDDFEFDSPVLNNDTKLINDTIEQLEAALEAQ